MNHRSRSVDGLIIGLKQQENNIKKLNNSIITTKSQLEDRLQKLDKLKAIQNGELILDKYAKKMKVMYEDFLDNEELKKENYYRNQKIYQLNQINEYNQLQNQNNPYNVPIQENANYNIYKQVTIYFYIIIQLFILLLF